MKKLDPSVIAMVEKAIHDAPDYPTKQSLWKSLPRKVSYNTLNQVVDHLILNNKVIIDRRCIIWVFVDNPKLKKLLRNSVRVWPREGKRSA